MTPKAKEPIPGWDELRHAGLLLDASRLHSLAGHVPDVLDQHVEHRLRQKTAASLGRLDEPVRTSEASQFVSFVLEEVCGFGRTSGNWQRGSHVPVSQSRRAVTGEAVKPHQLWIGSNGTSLPVFFGEAKRIGIGHGRRIVSQVLEWLRAGTENLALVTNGRQWRLVFAGLDYDASCEWDTELWFEEGEVAAQVTALRTLLCPQIWTPDKEDAASPLLQAVRDSRKGQAELSEVLGERVREAVEILVKSHGENLKELTHGDNAVQASEIYRAACRIAMRSVVILFAESRDLLPRDNPVYDESYGLNGLLVQLEQRDARGESMREAFGAWPRVLALFRMVSDGSHHPDLPVTAYGGELFSAGNGDTEDGVSRALGVFETACFEGEIVSDRDVYKILHLLMRTKARIRQGRGGTWVTVPVDFSDLSSEYIGIVYEGLLDYELKTAPAKDAVVFLAVGERPALPLSRLEEMDAKAIRELFKKLNKHSSSDEVEEQEQHLDEELEVESDPPDAEVELSTETDDERGIYRAKAEEWTRRAAAVAHLIRKPRGQMTPERRLAYERELSDKAQRLVHQHVLPGEWYLARWGGTRKGSGSFYTRPGLAVPTVQRALRPLAYNSSTSTTSGDPRALLAAEWTPKSPEEILALKVCDPACGSGSFALAALRFLTEALYTSLRHHGRIEPTGNQSLVRMLGINRGDDDEGGRLSDERIPCAPDDPDFESRLKARLRRHVVERCIYAVDRDPLAIELCRLSLWIETMDRELPFGFLDHKVKCGNALVGAWFDQFQHYPAMAWKNRDGGDKNHSNGSHFTKDARSDAIKVFHKDRLTPDMRRFLEGPRLFEGDLLKTVTTTHSEAINVLVYMHELPTHDAVERAEVYRKDLLGSNAWRSLKEAMDLWCACWFWPVDQIEHAPLPTSFGDPPEVTQRVARKVAARHRFFHWELEFPDVFDTAQAGFDAVLGNPPWDIAKPVSLEFFSNIDPLYRSYGKQEALRKQTEYFKDEAVERDWLDYRADFRALSNFVGRTRNPFGDPEKSANSQHKFNLGKGNADLHRRWRSVRGRAIGFADPLHPFRHQGSADLNLYKMFCEAAHALAREGGRIGFVVPSGLYSDNGTAPLRKLFLEQCRWEWLFGIENRAKIFPIDGRAKFNPVIIQKGGSTNSIQTVFMRRDVEDWESAEDLATSYSRTQVERLSPNNRAILEIQSQRDLEILGKIYANSVLLGDDGPNGWGLKYVREFDMTGDSKLFPPRPKWEERGYLPDEYNRWLKGEWRPIEALWAELGVNEAQPVPPVIGLEDWLFDGSANPERRQSEAQFTQGHLLKPGDVSRTDWAVRCAQPPYDRLPVPRTAIPPGIILSREGTEWIRDGGGIEDVALPLYEGRMIGQFDFSEKGWVSGKGRSAEWRDIPSEGKQLEPQFLMGLNDYKARIESHWRPKMTHMSVGSATNTRTAIGTLVCGVPGGHKAPMLYTPDAGRALALTVIYNSLAYDFLMRARVVGLTIDYHVLEQSPLIRLDDALVRLGNISELARALCLTPPHFSPSVLELLGTGPGAGSNGMRAAITDSERLRLRVILDALVASAFGLDYSDLCRILDLCDLPTGEIVPGLMNPKGFWRLDRNRDPELRHPVLTLIAFRDLESKIRKASGSRNDGICAFLAQNHGEGWLLPETLRLADYELGHDHRARCHQPVAQRLGPRFYDWQLASTEIEFRRETHLHARNLLGLDDYAQLVSRNLGDDESDSYASAPVARDSSRLSAISGRVFQAVQPKTEGSATSAQSESPKDSQMDLFE